MSHPDGICPCCDRPVTDHATSCVRWLRLRLRELRCLRYERRAAEARERLVGRDAELLNRKADIIFPSAEGEGGMPRDILNMTAAELRALLDDKSWADKSEGS